MIVVRVELHSAINGEVTELARMHICNEGGTDDLRSYGGYVARGRGKDSLDLNVKHRGWNHTGKIEGWPSKRMHVWNLVLSMLLACGYRGPMPHDHSQGPMRTHK